MKASICPNCIHYQKNEDSFFGTKTRCVRFQSLLDNVIITQCQAFKEVEQ